MFCALVCVLFDACARAYAVGWFFISLLFPCFIDLWIRLVMAFVIIPYNFQRWMSWLEHRWRAQRSAISILNCRIPWTNRNLNAYCAFGISLKACLLQCLCLFIPAKSHCTICCECLCLMMCMHLMMCSWDIWEMMRWSSTFLTRIVRLFDDIAVSLLLNLVDLLNYTTWS